MGTEGEFQFTNGSLINSKIASDRNAAVCRHEIQHAELYTSTTFGQLTLMMEKNALFHEKSNWLYRELFNYSSRMQERISVNVENLDIFIKEGNEAYNSALNNLESRNRTYYNHFKKLCCINGKVNSEEEASYACKMLRAFGRIALNVNIEEIPFETMNESKDLQKFMSIEKNAKKYIPNVRFDAIVDVFCRSKSDMNKIVAVLEGSIKEENINSNAIHTIAVNKAKKILSDSFIYERLVTRVSTVGATTYDIYCDNIEYLYSMPLDLNRKDKLEMKELSPHDFIEKIYAKKYINELVFLPHSMGGFEDIHAISFWDSHKKKMYTTIILDDNEFDNIIKKFPQHIVFMQTKLFRKMKSRIRGMAQRLPVFICLENSIYHGIDFISKNFKNGFYSFLHQDEYEVLIIWRGSYIFIAYIIDLAKKELEKIFLGFNMEFKSYDKVELNKEIVEKVALNCMENMILSNNL